ncbi:hypothetical protein [Deinococcus fonticola]|uniref:hypothetical protein n=1 Tax=Deinococcus fonticola TaxID=2528713 RepID=UPI0010757112|nr:hypothetical protein [Deinococcus fonticola]
MRTDQVMRVIMSSPDPHRGRLLLQIAAGAMRSCGPMFPGVELELPPGTLVVRESTGLPEFWGPRFSVHVMQDLHRGRSYGVLVAYHNGLVEQADAGDEPLRLFWQNLMLLLNR